MTTFDKREEGFEKEFAHDEELKFKAMARRNKLLGRWAAEKLGLRAPTLTPTPRRSSWPTSRKPVTTMSSARSARISMPAGSPSDHQIRRTMEELMGKASADQGRRRATGGAAGAASSFGSWLIDGIVPALPSPRGRAGETVYTGWCGTALTDGGRDRGARGLPGGHARQQHGLWDIAELASGSRLCGTAARRHRARTGGDFARVSRALDFGAEGIIAPMINTAEDARALAASPSSRRSANAAGGRIAP